METIVWVVVPVALGFGALWYLKHRGTRDSELKAKADKRTGAARADADAIQRSLDNRR